MMKKKKLCNNLANFKISWSARRLKTRMQETMIIKEGMIVATTMVITMRGVVIMMKAQDSLQDLIFHNLKAKCMLMTSLIGLIRWNISLSIVTPP